MNFIRGEARGRTDGDVVTVYDTGQVEVPVVLMFVGDHGKHLCHGVVDPFNATVSARVVGAGREFVYVE